MPPWEEQSVLGERLCSCWSTTASLVKNNLYNKLHVQWLAQTGLCSHSCCSLAVPRTLGLSSFDPMPNSLQWQIAGGRNGHLKPLPCTVHSVHALLDNLDQYARIDKYCLSQQKLQHFIGGKWWTICMTDENVWISKLLCTFLCGSYLYCL